ncbi:hypothetical protein GZH53_13495 [Flavihumibacter sp. R14]|nr:hypothetical protein [Flavihumibacter soli]
MNDKIELNDGSTALNIISWLFGIVAFFIGLVNAFWGNDPGFGVFVLLLSFIYFLPVNTILKKMTGFTIPGIRIIRVLLGIFIIWAAMGVGELFDKIEMMTNSL